MRDMDVNSCLLTQKQEQAELPVADDSGSHEWTVAQDAFIRGLTFEFTENRSR
jgi:hypothetical protein